MASIRRGPWSQSEDAYLTQLVHTQGALNWVRIAQLIGTRSPKQCRERYHQNLKPTLNHEPISPEEGLQIEHLVAEMGKRWAEIARRLNGRSDNAVKNWWNGSMNRRRRLVVRRGGSSSSPTSSRSPRNSDGRARSPSFARPPMSSMHRPLPLTSSNSTTHRSVDPALPSPAISDMSRADSLEGAPSLMSDCGSTISISPRVASSPRVELPPLSGMHSESRRPSLPALQFMTSAFISEADARGHAFTSRFHNEAKLYASNNAQQPVSAQLESNFYSDVYQRDGEARPQLWAAPAPIQLPPLQSYPRNSDKRILSTERDSRMHLSSLLG